jgi:hypothetical protein
MPVLLTSASPSCYPQSLTTLVGLHVAMLFEWRVQDLPSGYGREQEKAWAGIA